MCEKPRIPPLHFSSAASSAGFIFHHSLLNRYDFCHNLSHSRLNYCAKRSREESFISVLQHKTFIGMDDAFNDGVNKQSRRVKGGATQWRCNMSMLIRKNDRDFLAENPISELMRNFFSGFPEVRGGWEEFLPESRLEVKVGEKDVTVKFPCAGCTQKDFQLEVSGDFLSVTVAKRQEPIETQESHFSCRERSFEEYSESVKLPVEVQSADAKAKYVNGVLEVMIPRADVKKVSSKLIEVK